MSEGEVVDETYWLMESHLKGGWVSYLYLSPGGCGRGR